MVEIGKGIAMPLPGGVEILRRAEWVGVVLAEVGGVAVLRIAGKAGEACSGVMNLLLAW